MLHLPLYRTLLSIFDPFPQTEGAGIQRYPDVACDFRIFLLPVLWLLIFRNVRRLDWCFKYNEPDAFLTKLMTFLTPVTGKFMEGDPSGLWHSRTLWVRYQTEFDTKLSLEQGGFSQEQSLSTLEQSHKNSLLAQHRLKVSSKNSGILEGNFKRVFHPRYRRVPSFIPAINFYIRFLHRKNN